MTMKTSDKHIFPQDASGRTDDAIRKLVKDQLPAAPADEWFTNKVMNRLPEKRYRSRLSLPEKLCYLAGALTLITGWGCSLAYTLAHGLTITILTLAAVLPVVAFVCICVFAIPAIKKVL